MIRFIRDPQSPNTQYKQGMVRELGAVLNAQFIASGDAVDVAEPGEVFPPAKRLLPAGTVQESPIPALTAIQVAATQALVSDAGKGLGMPEYDSLVDAALAQAFRVAALASAPAVVETLPAIASGTGNHYFIDNIGGANGNNGTAQATPWADVWKLMALNPGVGAVIHLAADCLFEYEQTWANYKASPLFVFNGIDSFKGTLAAPIVVKPYYPRKTGTKPVIRWFAKMAAGDWTLEAGYGGKVYSTPWVKGSAVSREMMLLFGSERRIGMEPGQNSNLPAGLTMADQWVADGSKLWIYVPDGSNPVTYYGEIRVTGAQAVFQTAWDGGQYFKIFGIQFEQCMALRMDNASTGTVAVKGVEMAYCTLSKCLGVYFRNQTTTNPTEAEISLHDNLVYDSPASVFRIADTVGNAGNLVSWEVYRNGLWRGNLQSSYGGALLYVQAKGGTKHIAWGNYGYDARNGAGGGSGAAQIDGCFLYADVGVNKAIFFANIGERCGSMLQSNRAIGVVRIANLGIDCGSMCSSTASAGNNPGMSTLDAHNTWHWTGRISQSDLQHGPNIGGDGVGRWDTWPVWEMSNQQYGIAGAGGGAIFDSYVFVNNLAINASGAQLTAKPMMEFAVGRVTTAVIGGSSAFGMANAAIVNKDNGADITLTKHYMSIIGTSLEGRLAVADGVNGVSRPALGSILSGAGVPLSVQYQDIGGRNFAARPTPGCYEINV